MKTSQHILALSLIASLASSIQTASFDMITPTKKACSDITCIASRHPGAIALAAFSTGIMIMGSQFRAKRELKNENEELDDTIMSVLDKSRGRNDERTVKTVALNMPQMQKLISKNDTLMKEIADHKTTYEEATKTIKANQAKYITVDNDASEQDKQQQEQHVAKINSAIGYAIPNDGEPKDDKEAEKIAFVHSYLETKKELAFDKNRHDVKIGVGAFITLSAMLGYGTYKSYPYWRKWFAKLLK